MEWILVLIVQTGAGNTTLKYESKASTLADCEKAAKTFNAKIPSGGDAESGLAVVCAKGGMEFKR